MISALRCSAYQLAAVLATGMACTAVNAAVTLLGVQYQEDDWFPEFNCIWKDRDYPTSCIVGTDVGCNIHAYLKNTGGSSVTVSSVSLEGYNLETVLKLNEGVHNARSIYFYWDHPPQDILDAGEPVWYKVDPSTPIPAGGVAQVVVRLRFVPVTNPINLSITTSGGAVNPSITVDANAPQLANVGFSQDRKKVYLHWRRSGGAAPTTIKMDGTDVTSNATTVSDPNTNFAVTVLSFSTALDKMSYHVYQGVYADGKTATASLRTWVNKFMHGTYNTFDVESYLNYTIEDWIAESSDHGINNCQVSVGKVVNYLNTGAGEADMLARGYGYTSGDKTKFDTRGHGPDMFFINDEVDAEDANMERTFCGTGYKLPCGHSPMGILAMRTIDEGEVLRDLRPFTPTSVNINGTHKPENYYSYGQAVDILQVDPYYQRRLQDAYWRDQNMIPLYEKATYIYAVSKAVARAAEPNPSNVILYSCAWKCTEGRCDDQYVGQIWPYADPETKRIEVYYALAAGAKGLCYWWFNWSGWPSHGLGDQSTQAARDLWREIGLYGNEIKTVRDQLVTSHPIDLSITPSTNVWAKALASGTDTIILLAVNDDYYNDTSGFHHNVVSNASVTVELPNWMLSSPTAFEVAASGISSVTTSLNGSNLTVILGTLDVTKMILITVNPQLMMTIRQRYDTVIWPAVCTFASSVCQQNTSGPTFVQHPLAQSPLAGGSVAFTIAANGGSQFSYQWQKNGLNLSNGGHYSGCNTFALTVSNCDSSDEASYRCVVTNPYGSATSNAAILTLSTVDITQQPTAQYACLGGTAQFSVTATGEGTLTYRWQKNQVNLNNGGHYSGVTTSTLTVSNADSNDEADYRCAVTDNTSTVYSDEAALTVQAGGATITQQPSNEFVEAGETAEFSVTASGAGTLTYRWQKNQVNLTNGGHYSGVTTATLTVSSVDSNDEANYRCIVTDDCGSTISNEASLTIDACGLEIVFQNGDFEDWPTGLVAPYWTGAYNEAVANQFVKSTSIVRTGTYAQGVRARDAIGAWAHVYQGFDTNVGDALTILAYAYPTAIPAGVNPQVGVNTSSARPSSWLYTLSSFTRNTWCTLGPLSCNATGTSTYLFLDVKRVGAVDTTTYWDDVALFHAYVPAAPTVGSPTSSTLDVNVHPGCNADNADAQYAISIGGGAYTLGTHWVQANGSVGTTAVWQTDATWSTKTVTGLTTGMTYTFEVKARYSSAYTQETSLGAGAEGTPEGGCTPPGAPTDSTPQVLGATSIRWRWLDLAIETGYRVRDTGGVDKSGLLPADTIQWTETTGIAPNTQYTRYIHAVNACGESDPSAGQTARTLSAAPEAGSVTPSTSDLGVGEDIVWTAVGGFGAGTVQYYRYAWDQSSTYEWTGSELQWSSGTLTTSPTVSGIWYLHVQGYNADDVANGTYDYDVNAGGVVIVAADLDGDGDVDMTDFGLFQVCLSVPNQVLPNCGGSDLNSSGEVDSDDLDIFLQCLSGESIPADPNCAE